MKELLEDYIKKTKPEYYPPVENLLDLIYEHYTENNPVEKNTAAGKAAKEKEKELERWLRGLDGMDRLVEDYGGQIPLWEKIMDPQGIIQRLGLLDVDYNRVSAYGHFGKAGLPWEE